MDSKVPISAFIITLNNAHEIEACLRSIAFVDEVVVVDSLSTDGTQGICRRMGARVIEQPFLGYSHQLQFAETRCKHDWALNLYADETLSSELQAEMLGIFGGSLDPPVNGFRMRRRQWLHKQWIYKGDFYPAWHLRLFRRSAGGHLPERVHQKIRVRGGTQRLRGTFDHWNWARQGELFDNFTTYARAEAEDTLSREPITIRHSYIPWKGFLKRFIGCGGWKQGDLGATVCSYAACSAILRYVIALDLQNGRDPAMALTLFDQAVVEADALLRGGEPVTAGHFVRPWRDFFRRFVLLRGLSESPDSAASCLRSVFAAVLPRVIVWERQNAAFLDKPNDLWCNAQAAAMPLPLESSRPRLKGEG